MIKLIPEIYLIMIKLIKSLFFLLTKDQRRRFYILQILIILMASMEIIGVASIIPFMALVGNMDLLNQDTVFAQIYLFSGISSKSNFIFVTGLLVLSMLLVAALISMLTSYRLAVFSAKVGAEISSRLYTHYLRQDWLFHASGSSAQLTRKIATEAGRVSGQIVMPLMNMNARIVLVFSMSSAVFIYDPVVAIIGLLIFSIAYFVLFKVVRISLQRNGKAISETNEERFRLMQEGFGGIKELLVLGRENYFVKFFNQTSQKLAYSRANNIALALVPRYLIELIAFGSMITLLLYLIAAHDGRLEMILPILSVYVLATFKLLPAFQQIYVNIAEIKGNMSAFEAIKQDLLNSNQNLMEKNINNNDYLIPEHKISLENISFTYPTKKEPALNQLNFSIHANSIIGIVGPSGAGKSTLIDVFLGLLKPQHGHLKIDDTIIDNQNLRNWQNLIGFVSQNIFLSEGSIAENIAFGIENDQINFSQVKKVLKLAYLEEFVESLEKGFDTKVGERGVQLSGGQRQRIGIARALYHKAQILVFDEATSSLDGITEKMIMEAIHDLGNHKTIIIIAHRLQTVKKCDQIFFLDNGKVADQGTFEELLEKNQKFKKMAINA